MHSFQTKKVKNIKFLSSKKSENKNENISTKNRQRQKKDIMKIIQKRLNNTFIKKNDIKNVLTKSLDNKKINKDNTINAVNNNINVSNKNNYNYINKVKLVKKNKKVKFSIPIGNSDNKKNKSKKSENKPKSNKMTNIKNNNNNNNTLINTINNSSISKKNIIHRHTKSSFIQGNNLLKKIFKDISVTHINNNNIINNFENNNIINSSNNYKKKITLNNFVNYNNNKIKNDNKKRTKIVSKLNKNIIKNFQNIQMINKDKNENKNININNNMIHSYREGINNKGGLIQIIEELNFGMNNNYNNINNNTGYTRSGLTKKFIEAQNIWRKNYFATVIQKIFKGYNLRKKYYLMKNRNQNSVYVRKKIKGNYINSSIIHHRKCPTEENINFICNNLNLDKSAKNIRINHDNKNPPKIKEIVISMKSKNDFGYYNNNSNYSFYYNNFRNNLSSYNINNKIFEFNTNYYNMKYIFDMWKEYSEKKKIIKKLKIFQKSRKNNSFPKTSYKKQNNNRYNF